ncbi:hypothetical protein ACFVSN_14430 [Kitasatospora sp. NPDC057904]|uniref:hypothetical protein n=1 Tax=Kitasatospora sp. NPDC057904 TaxID=3346275 RepID=UPI0036D959A8
MATAERPLDVPRAAKTTPSKPKCVVCAAFERIADAEMRRRYPEARMPGVLAELEKIRARHMGACRAVADVPA